jgi:hypothetical protein
VFNGGTNAELATSASIEEVNMRPLILGCSAVLLIGAVHAPRQDSRVAAQDSATVKQAEVNEILAHMSLVELDDGQGHKTKTLRISGLNVQIVNGAGATCSDSGVGPGLGNLIVGYNESGSAIGDIRTGSHNLVVGQMNSYSGCGCLVAGTSNCVSGIFTTVTGGTMNRSTGTAASVAGGSNNVASGTASSVAGGAENLASGTASAVLGGFKNDASGTSSTVRGGQGLAAKETCATLPK